MDFCIFVVLVYIAFVLSIGLFEILHTLDDIQKQIDKLPDIGLYPEGKKGVKNRNGNMDRM